MAKISHHIRRVRPQVVMTFDPIGAYGHPDHIAISQFTHVAILTAADARTIDPNGYLPHRVSKLYYMVDTQDLVDMVKEVFGRVQHGDDGVKRMHTAWPDWSITTRIDASAFWDVGVEAIACHETQVAEMMAGMRSLPKTHDPRIWTVQSYYRVYSLVNGGRKVETDLFEGIR